MSSAALAQLDPPDFAGHRFRKILDELDPAWINVWRDLVA
jgi:hypothetical protein